MTSPGSTFLTNLAPIVFKEHDSETTKYVSPFLPMQRGLKPHLSLAAYIPFLSRRTKLNAPLNLSNVVNNASYKLTLFFPY